MLNDLLLLSGNDIPFPEAQVTIHQPTIKEIGYIGEESFFTGCELLNFSKDFLDEKDKVNLKDKSNFEIFMSIMKERNSPLSKNRTCTMLVLTLIFPTYRIEIKDKEICLLMDDEPPHAINEKNYEEFKSIIVDMFCLKNKDSQDYNPQGEKAQEIANKLKRGRAKAAAVQGNTGKIAILSRYVSVLAIGNQKDMNSLLQYTVYQLYDEFERFELKISYDMYTKAKFFGAKDLQEVDNWMKDIH